MNDCSRVIWDENFYQSKREGSHVLLIQHCSNVFGRLCDRLNMVLAQEGVLLLYQKEVKGVVGWFHGKIRLMSSKKSCGN